MKVLLTGFEPFGQSKINPSWELVNAMPSTYKGIELKKVKLPVSYTQVSQILPKCLEAEKPDYVLSFGVCSSAEIRLERVALNVDDTQMGDNDGNFPVDAPIQPAGPAAYFATLPIRKILGTLQQANIPTKISNSAGTYVCNHTLYECLYWMDQHQVPTQAGFIHLPHLPEEDMGKPTLPLETMVSACCVILDTLIEEYSRMINFENSKR